MAKPHVLASGIVEPGGGSPGAVVAFVAVNFGLEGSRLFKLIGPTDAPQVQELEGATTIDLGRFRRELEQDLEPALEAIRARGGTGAITEPAASWVCSKIRDHLQSSEGIRLDV